MTPAPIVEKKEYLCMDNVDGFLSLMDRDSGEMKEDIKLPEEAHLKDKKDTILKILKEEKKECLVTVQKWGDKEQAILVREGD